MNLNKCVRQTYFKNNKDLVVSKIMNFKTTLI